MRIEVERHTLFDNCTISSVWIDDTFQCYGMEPVFILGKDKKPRAIPAGKYNVGFRKQGLMLQKLIRRNLGIGQDRGTLHVQDVPGFKYILIHIGNTKKDTQGCLLTGYLAGNERIYQSTNAYKAFYKKVANALDTGEEVTIEYIDAWD